MSEHPFERYAAYTNLAALQAASAKPLRKSLRVNTLKTSVAAFKAWAAKAGWQLTPVPWCPEGFFVEREDRSTALGKDLLHLLGHVYMQEAASMLPVALLDPQPGERVLDMSAAPGSKTTQIAARMRGTGVVVANDVQEKRLQTLKSALYRSGVPNAFLTRKQGQWFGANMVGRFDRVLCDAPCTAQGTVRKDASALEYSSERSIHAMAALQFSLLESAVHAAKVGGRIVYSTCTLTPEENEMLVRSILNKYCDQLIVLDMGKKSEVRSQKPDLFEAAIQDSKKVQQQLQETASCPLASDLLPFLRLWPQTYDTEGFFCAVLRKEAPTAERIHARGERFQERPIRHREQDAIAAHLTEQYGTSFLHEGDQLFELDDQLLLSTEEVQNFSIPVRDYALGLPFAKLLKDGRCRLTHDLAIARGMMATSNCMEMKDEQLNELFAGRDTTCSKALDGDVILQWQGMAIGIGLAQQGVLKNRISRWLVQLTSE